MRKHVKMGTGTSTASSVNQSPNKSKKIERYSIPPSVSPTTATVSNNPTPESSPIPMSSGGFRRSFCSLLRTSSFDDPVQTQMFVLGMPRPCDVAPNQPLHTGKKDLRNHNRNASTGKAYKIPIGDIFNSNVPRSSPPCHFTPSGSNGSLPSFDDRYYNMITSTTSTTTSMTLPHNRRRHSIGAYFNRKGAYHSQIQEETSFSNRTERVDGGSSKNEGCSSLKKKCNRCCPAKGKIFLNIFFQFGLNFVGKCGGHYPQLNHLLGSKVRILEQKI